MKKAVLLLGMGYTGCNTVDSVYADLLFALQTKDSPLCRALAFDTHHHDLQGIKHAAPIQLANMAFASPGRAIETAEADLMRTLFDIDSVDFKAPSLFLDKQGRKTACLAFYHILNEPMRRRRLHQELDELIAACEEGEVTLFTVASLAGDTGAGTFLPITLYVKDYLTKRGCTVKAKALLARPDCYPITDPQKKSTPKR